ncbi:MAG: LCP family protein, partial [Nocardiaceae bacterium]|nr:LCP family protein [Nocardiaceae bacterium]
IPRDDYVDVPGYGKLKIKEAYGSAKADADAELEAQGVTDPTEREQRARDAGRRSTLKTVQNLLHVPIDHFAEVNLVGFYDIAQALGPLEVCLNSPVDDPYSGAHFPAGHQSLDPSQALSFVRQRHGLDNGDLDRTRRQQAFLTAVIRNLDSAGVFGSVSKMRGLFDTVKSDVVVDDDLDPVSFATHARNLTRGKLDFYTLPVEGYETIDGAAVNIVDPKRLRTEVSRLFAGEGPGPTTTTTTTTATTTTTTPPTTTSSKTPRAGTHTTTTTPDTSTPLEAPPPEEPVVADDSNGIPCVD